jgi:hypothetical protein
MWLGLVRVVGHPALRRSGQWPIYGNMRNYLTSNGRTGFTDRNAVTDAAIVERVRRRRPG